jgi:hypothetical protein
MGKTIKTSLYCFDDHRGFTEELRKRFTDTARYSVFSFNTREEFLGSLASAKDKGFCKVAILGVHDTKDHFELIEQMTLEVKRLDQGTGLILICPTDKIEEIKKSIRFNIDAFIPKNSNTILRIHNIVKKLIGEHNVRFYRKKRNFSFYLLLAFFLLSLITTAIAFIRFPQYF